MVGTTGGLGWRTPGSHSYSEVETELGTEQPDQQQRTGSYQEHDLDRPAWRVILSSWWPEFVSCAVSIASAAALAIVLHHFNGKALPVWPLGLTLNTLIAFLATISRSTFIIPATESVSQFKWLWFQSPRPLRDFQTFDEASRGPWGSLKLLVRTKASFSSVMVAVILFTAFFTATLTQSVVSYPSRLAKTEKPDAMSSVARTSYLSGSYQKNQPWERIVYYGLNADPAKPVELEKPVCSTSNCEFPVLSSLSVCAKYWNVTSLLNFTSTGNTGQNATLPNGVNGLVNRDKSHTITTLRSGYSDQYTPIWATSSNFTVGDTSLANFTIIWSKEMPHAYEVLLYFCVKRYKISVVDNIASWELLNTDDEPVDDEGVADLKPAEVGLKRIPTKHGRKLSSKAKDILNTMQYFLRDIFSGSMSVMDVNNIYAANSHLGPGRYYWATTAAKNGSRPDLTPAEVHREALMNVTENLATTLTNSLHNARVIGAALDTETYVEVRWVWMTFITAQICLSIILLSVVIIRTHLAGIAAIKTASLPTLFAVKSSDRFQLEAGSAPEKVQDEYFDLQRRGTGVMDSLTRTDNGWRFDTSRKG